VIRRLVVDCGLDPDAGAIRIEKPTLDDVDAWLDEHTVDSGPRGPYWRGFDRGRGGVLARVSHLERELDEARAFRALAYQVHGHLDELGVPRHATDLPGHAPRLDHTLDLEERITMLGVQRDDAREACETFKRALQSHIAKLDVALSAESEANAERVRLEDRIAELEAELRIEISGSAQ